MSAARPIQMKATPIAGCVYVLESRQGRAPARRGRVLGRAMNPEQRDTPKIPTPTVAEVIRDDAAHAFTLTAVDREAFLGERAAVLDGLVADPKAALAAAMAELTRVPSPPTPLPPCHRSLCRASRPPSRPRADILRDFATALHSRGVVGEDRFAKVTYLCLTSRVLDAARCRWLPRVRPAPARASSCRRSCSSSRQPPTTR